MGRKKLLEKLADFFNLDARARNQNKEDLHDLLTRLKKKEVELKELMELEKDPEHKSKIAQKVDVVHSQRKKGVQMLKDLKES